MNTVQNFGSGVDVASQPSFFRAVGLATEALGWPVVPEALAKFAAMDGHPDLSGVINALKVFGYEAQVHTVTPETLAEAGLPAIVVTLQGHSLVVYAREQDAAGRAYAVSRVGEEGDTVQAALPESRVVALTGAVLVELSRPTLKRAVQPQEPKAVDPRPTKTTAGTVTALRQAGPDVADSATTVAAGLPEFQTTPPVTPSTMGAPIAAVPQEAATPPSNAAPSQSPSRATLSVPAAEPKPIPPRAVAAPAPPIDSVPQVAVTTLSQAQPTLQAPAPAPVPLSTPAPIPPASTSTPDLALMPQPPTAPRTVPQVASPPDVPLIDLASPAPAAVAKTQIGIGSPTAAVAAPDAAQLAEPTAPAVAASPASTAVPAAQSVAPATRLSTSAVAPIKAVPPTPAPAAPAVAPSTIASIQATAPRGASAAALAAPPPVGADGAAARSMQNKVSAPKVESRYLDTLHASAADVATGETDKLCMALALVTGLLGQPLPAEAFAEGARRHTDGRVDVRDVLKNLQGHDFYARLFNCPLEAIPSDAFPMVLFRKNGDATVALTRLPLTGKESTYQMWLPELGSTTVIGEATLGLGLDSACLFLKAPFNKADAELARLKLMYADLALECRALKDASFPKP